jgi:predicted TIM-barrel fold metal-dependent hydrolase
MCRKRRKPMIVEDLYFLNQNKPAIYPIDNESRDRQRLASSLKDFSDYAKRMLEPIFREFSSVPFSLAHCGVANVKLDYDAIFDLINWNSNVSCDVCSVLAYNSEFIENLVKAVGAHEVMYGSDSPWGGDCRRRWGVIADQCPSLSDQQKQLILAGNTERFVNFQPAAAL